MRILGTPIAFEMSCYKRILLLPVLRWQDQRTNIDIRHKRQEVQREETVMDIIRKKKLWLFGHVYRLPDD